MKSDFEIGRIVAVDTSEVTIELNSDLKAMTRITYERTIEIGKINSYVIIPVGARRIVAMVTRVLLTEEAELRTDKTMVTLPSARRIMKATMIGTIENKNFTQGIGVFPILDNPVLVASQEDLKAIFDVESGESDYCIPIGNSAIFPEFNICINPDIFFGKHAAILGSTGSGKSCTIASIIQSVLEMPQVKNTRFIILDTNGEYRGAFQKEENGQWSDVNARYRCLYLSTDIHDPQGHNGNQFKVPYWFMNSEDFIKLFRASEGVQRPVLLDALKRAKEAKAEEDQSIEYSWRTLREALLGTANEIYNLSFGKEERHARFIDEMSDGILKLLEREWGRQAVKELTHFFPGLTKDYLLGVFKSINEIACEGGVKKPDFVRHSVVNSDKEISIKREIKQVIKELSKVPSSESDEETERPITVDSPRYFSKMNFRRLHLDASIAREDVNSSRARDNCSTMLMRIYRLLEDKRFEFLFGPVNDEWPPQEHSLATFLRDIIGLAPGDKELSPEEDVPEGLLPFYDRQRAAKKAGKTDSHNIVIIDLSLLSTEVLENITALIGRLVLEFMQRVGEERISGISRGSFPVVLVLEEAQNYIKEGSESISREVFERIAREGRKYGLGLVISSQRPSELSKTVLSQCNSFIVHRLQNPEDLRYFREVVPGIYEQLLKQLSALAPRYALALGECVRAPAMVYIREAVPTTQSQDPEFYKEWTSDNPSIPNVEEVCKKWENG